MKKLMVFVLLCALFVDPGRSYALSCVEPPPPDAAFEEYDAVLIGSVEKIQTGLSAKTVTIEVEKSFKGVNEKTISVFEDITWGESQVGATYLFFLNREGGKWIHPLCSPTTHKTVLADEYFYDKPELMLQEVKSSGGESYPLPLIVLMSAMAAVAAAAVLLKLAKNSKKP